MKKDLRENGQIARRREGAKGRRGGSGGGLIRSRRVALMQSHQPVSGSYGTVARASVLPFELFSGLTYANLLPRKSPI